MSAIFFLLQHRCAPVGADRVRDLFPDRAIALDKRSYNNRMHRM